MKRSNIVILCSAICAGLFVVTIITSAVSWNLAWDRAEKHFKTDSLQDFPPQLTVTPTITPIVIAETKPTGIEPVQPTVVSLAKVEKLPVEEQEDVILEGNAPCQPANFDPAISKYSKYSDGTSNLDRYKIDSTGETQYLFRINGVAKQDDVKVQLPAPYLLTQYVFGCASSYSYVLDLVKSNVRAKLLTNISKFVVSPDSKKLFYLRYVEEGSKWKLVREVLNLDTMLTTRIIDNTCISSDISFTSNNYVVSASRTYGEYPNDITYFCEWGIDAKSVGNFSATNLVRAGSQNSLYTQFGILPLQGTTLYLYSYSQPDPSYSGTCSLFMYDLIKQLSVEIPLATPFGGSGYCSQTEFDLKYTSVSSKSVRYRYQIATDEGERVSSWAVASKE